MRKFATLSLLALPVMAFAQVDGMGESYVDQSAMMNNYSVSPVWSIFGWLMLIGMLVWIVVGVLAAMWLWKNLNR